MSLRLETLDLSLSSVTMGFVVFLRSETPVFLPSQSSVTLDLVMLLSSEALGIIYVTEIRYSRLGCTIHIEIIDSGLGCVSEIRDSRIVRVTENIYLDMSLTALDLTVSLR